MDLLTNPILWASLSGVAAVISLWLIRKDLVLSRHSNSYQFLMQQRENFDRPSMCASRRRVALLLRDGPVSDYLPMQADAKRVLGYFEELGLMLRQGLAAEYTLWTMNGTELMRYVSLLQGFIDWRRTREQDPTLYIESVYLCDAMLRFEMMMRRRMAHRFDPRGYLRLPVRREAVVDAAALERFVCDECAEPEPEPVAPPRRRPFARGHAV